MIRHFFAACIGVVIVIIATKYTNPELIDIIEKDPWQFALGRPWGLLLFWLIATIISKFIIDMSLALFVPRNIDLNRQLVREVLNDITKDLIGDLKAEIALHLVKDLKLKTNLIDQIVKDEKFTAEITRIVAKAGLEDHIVNRIVEIINLREKQLKAKIVNIIIAREEQSKIIDDMKPTETLNNG
jgi:hypothetical protein